MDDDFWIESMFKTLQWILYQSDYSEGLDQYCFGNLYIDFVDLFDRYLGEVPFVVHILDHHLGWWSFVDILQGGYYE